MNEIAFSFIIPHKNTPDLLQKCLDSIPRRDDVQIIVVDDNSDPEKVDFDHFPGLEDSMVEVVFDKKGGGCAYATNIALDHAVGKWVVRADADDFFCPDIAVAMDENRDAQFVFAKLEAFGDNETFNELYNTGKVFDYSFFSFPTKQQYEHMVFNNAHLPAPTFFCNRKAFSLLGVVNDERIPYAEDEAKWLNMLKKGARFYFVDEYTVRYRFGHPEALSSNGGIKRTSVERYKSNRAFNLLYKFPDQYALNPDEALNKLIELEARVYGDYYNMAERYDAINSSYAYKIGKIIMKPFSFVRHKILKK